MSLSKVNNFEVDQLTSLNNFAVNSLAGSVSFEVYLVLIVSYDLYLKYSVIRLYTRYPAAPKKASPTNTQSILHHFGRFFCVKPLINKINNDIVVLNQINDSSAFENTVFHVFSH